MATITSVRAGCRRFTKGNQMWPGEDSNLRATDYETRYSQLYLNMSLRVGARTRAGFPAGPLSSLVIAASGAGPKRVQSRTIA
jgi:hypothetical protein